MLYERRAGQKAAQAYNSPEAERLKVNRRQTGRKAKGAELTATPAGCI